MIFLNDNTLCICICGAWIVINIYTASNCITNGVWFFLDYVALYFVSSHHKLHSHSVNTLHSFDCLEHFCSTTRNIRIFDGCCAQKTIDTLKCMITILLLLFYYTISMSSKIIYNPVVAIIRESKAHHSRDFDLVVQFHQIRDPQTSSIMKFAVVVLCVTVSALCGCVLGGDNGLDHAIVEKCAKEFNITPESMKDMKNKKISEIDASDDLKVCEYILLV